MKLMLILSFLLTAHISAADPADDILEKRLQGMVDAGKPNLKKDSKFCGSKEEHPNQLYSLKEKYDDICVKHITLPKKVMAEVLHMADNQMENHSDYDQRVTMVYVFKTSSFSTDRIDSQDLTQLAGLFNIPDNLKQHFNVSLYKGNEDSLPTLEWLTMDYYEDEHYGDKPENLKTYLRKLIKGKNILHLTFTDGEETHPGGGIQVDYNFLLLEDMLIYFKHVGWDS